MAEFSVTFADGAKTVVETWGDRGQPLLCVHGMVSSRKSWVRLAQRLDGKYRVVAYDQRGHGDAAACKGPMTLAQQVEDLLETEAALPEPPIALVGHSWGGAVAILGGRELPVRGVIAIDPVLRVHGQTFHADYVEDAEAMAALGPQDREQFVLTHYAAWHPLDIAGKWHAVQSMTADPIVRLGVENHADDGGWNILDAVAHYPKPLEIYAAATAESVMSEDDVAHLRSEGGPKVRVVDFPDEGHNLHRTGFDAFAAEVERFLMTL